ncbi:MAG: hypothetical protein M2R46_01132 [Verrucomicrobia subdivision 3 bacterium]|nr:hypothetical protein [Limisphaerales bacterium]
MKRHQKIAMSSFTNGSSFLRNLNAVNYKLQDLLDEKELIILPLQINL